MIRKLLLRTLLSPGDTVMLTAAVRDLHKAYPYQFITGIDTTAPEIWENNPYITDIECKDEKYKNDQGQEITRKVPLSSDVETIECHYPLINSSNNKPHHFIEGYANYLERILKVNIPITEFKGDIHLSDEEKGWMPQVEEKPYELRRGFWIIVGGGKQDFTTKWWSPTRYQEVVDYFYGKIQFVQVGLKHHWHTPLKNVINLIGKTDTRQFIRLVYHADGVLCPITFAMHLAAAVETKPGKPKNRACVVVAGAREPSNWEAYPQQQYIHTCGTLPCCQNGGCWSNRCQLIGDGDYKDKEKVCERPIQISDDLRIPECMYKITSYDVIRRIEYFYCGGGLRYYS